jgi:putative ABC transport system substrate-binding protein
MTRKFLGLVLAMFVGTTVHPSAAQQRDKVFRLGYLTTAEPAADAARAGAIRAALRALGYVEGQNIVIEYRSSQGLTARLPELADDLVRFKVDLIIAAGGDV